MKSIARFFLFGAYQWRLCCQLSQHRFDRQYAWFWDLYRL